MNVKTGSSPTNLSFITDLITDLKTTYTYRGNKVKLVVEYNERKDGKDFGFSKADEMALEAAKILKESTLRIDRGKPTPGAPISMLLHPIPTSIPGDEEPAPKSA